MYWYVYSNVAIAEVYFMCNQFHPIIIGINKQSVRRSSWILDDLVTSVNVVILSGWSF